MLLCRVSRSSYFSSKSCGKSKGATIVLTEYPGVTEITSINGSKVYLSLLFSKEILSMVMLRRFNSGIAHPIEKLLLNQSLTFLSLYSIFEMVLSLICSEIP